MRCDQCQSWRRFGTQATPELQKGHCHRYPPESIGTWHDSVSADAWSFPVVYASAWCREFKVVPEQDA
jgi:hypothetical protein